jgi:hypothetical protein
MADVLTAIEEGDRPLCDNASSLSQMPAHASTLGFLLNSIFRHFQLGGFLLRSRCHSLVF